jgi:hypothetical protein
VTLYSLLLITDFRDRAYGLGLNGSRVIEFVLNKIAAFYSMALASVELQPGVA